MFYVEVTTVCLTATFSESQPDSIRYALLYIIDRCCGRGCVSFNLRPLLCVRSSSSILRGVYLTAELGPETEALRLCGFAFGARVSSLDSATLRRQPPIRDPFPYEVWRYGSMAIDYLYSSMRDLCISAIWEMSGRHTRPRGVAPPCWNMLDARSKVPESKCSHHQMHCLQIWTQGCP